MFVPGGFLRAANISSVTTTSAKTGITGMSSMATGINKTALSGNRTAARIKAATDARTASGILMTIGEAIVWPGARFAPRIVTSASSSHR
jgi:hypothetical protein